MGRLTSATNWAGYDIAGVTLGHPATEGGVYVWDGDVPDGTIDADGVVTVVVEPAKGRTPAVTDESPLGEFVGLRDLAEAEAVRDPAVVAEADAAIAADDVTP